MANRNFQEYTTSGAFNMSLSRTQVSALSMLSEIGDTGCATFSSTAALWKKGLIKDTSGIDDVPSGPMELTAAGHHVVSLINMAGLTNSPAGNYDTALDERLEEIRIIANQNRKLAEDNLSLIRQKNDLLNYIRILKEKQGQEKPTIFLGGGFTSDERCSCEMARGAQSVLETDQ